MKQVNIHEAKTHLSRLVEAAAKGEAFIIAKAGKPMVRVEAVDEAPPVDVSKRIGFLKGKVTLPDNFEEIDRELDREIAAMFAESAARGLFPEESEPDEQGSDPMVEKARRA
jgi:prevent-host-death family protein